MAYRLGEEYLLTTEDIFRRTKSIFTVNVEAINPEVLNKYKKLGEEFVSELERAFEEYVLHVHKYLIRVTPVDTGRLRGGWTAFLDAKQEDYSREMYDTSLAIKAMGATYNINQKDIAEGRTKSDFRQPDTLNVTVVNRVPYGFNLEHGAPNRGLQPRHFVLLTKYKAENLFQLAFDAWFEEIGKRGEVVPFKVDDFQMSP